MALTDKLTAIANAIRAKTGKTDSMTLEQMPTEIASITGGGGEGTKPFDCHSVTFMNGNTVLWVRSVADGDTCADPVDRNLISAPTKASDAQYHYTHYGWGATDGGAADANILKNITEDKTVYAIFSKTLRTYTITWLNDDGTLLESKDWTYGSTPSCTPPEKENHTFKGWIPDVSMVTGDATYTAKFVANEVVYDLANGVLTISGSGSMDDYASGKAPWYAQRSEITSIIVEDGVTHIGNYAFQNCNNATSITIPGSVTSLGNFVLIGCSSLTSITIPGSVTSLGNSVLSGCSSLTSITIPGSVTSIGNSVFRGCSSLSEIVVDASNPAYVNDNYGVLFDKNKTTLLAYPAALQNDMYSIPNGVTSIGGAAFHGSSLTSITIPESVTTIGDYTFDSCTSLTSITIPSSVTEIGSYAFQNCTSLTSITIPESVTTIGSGAFVDCSALTSIIIPDGVTTIDQGCFKGCSGLASFTIPKNTQRIGQLAFSGCTSLTSITIPSAVTRIDRAAFYNTSLTSAIFEDTTTWYVNSSNSTSGGTNIIVTKASTAATYLTTTHNAKWWYKK